MLQAVVVDPRRFCRDSRSWETESDVTGFPRLAQEFTQGALICRVAGHTDRRSGDSLRLTVQGEVGLICQRCLGALQHTVQIDRVVHLARSEAELERLEALPDSDAILVGETVDLLDLVEDEVILSLPLAAMHEVGECPA